MATVAALKTKTVKMNEKKKNSEKRVKSCWVYVIATRKRIRKGMAIRVRNIGQPHARGEHTHTHSMWDNLGRSSLGKKHPFVLVQFSS